MSGVARRTGVSRETQDCLAQYAALLRKWSPRINLVAPSTLPDLETRHIADSAQLLPHAPLSSRHWVDLGSGGGLPGIVCAILAQSALPECRFTLIESDRRKAAFLATCIQTLSLPATVLTGRAEDIAPQAGDVVSARALAALPTLMPLVARHLAPGGTALLPKGKSHAAELEAARGEWHFVCTAHTSQTDGAARLLVVKDPARV